MTRHGRSSSRISGVPHRAPDVGARLRGAADRVAPLAGLLGSVATLGAVVITAVAYTGSRGQSYSPLNHLVSELGERGVSELAAVFNAGVVVGGAAFVVFMAGFALVRGGALGRAAGLLGMAAGLCGILVGLFPMDTLAVHRVVAGWFFLLGCATLLLASLDIVLRPSAWFPRRLAVLGTLAFAAFAAFIPVFTLEGVDGFGAPDPRPSAWIVSALEWVAIAGLLAWTAATAVTWLRAGPGRAPDAAIGA